MTQSAPSGPANCPLCGAQDLVERDSLPVKDICHEYERQLKVDVTNEFPAFLRFVSLLECSDCGLQFYFPLISGSRLFYSELSRSPSYYSPRRWEFGRAASLVRTTDSVLDIGCGDGLFLQSIQVARAQGLEFNPEAVRRARAKGLDVSNGELSSLAPGAFDVITLFQVLEHVTDPGGILSEVIRIVRPGGVVLIAVPNNDGFVGSAMHEPLNVVPHHPLRWTHRALVHLQKQFPLRLTSLEEEPVGPDHVFPYRRCRVVQAFRRCFGGEVPLMRLNVRTVALRKIANALAMASLKVSRSLPPPKVPGHSYLAVYQREAAGGKQRCDSRAEAILC